MKVSKNPRQTISDSDSGSQRRHLAPGLRGRTKMRTGRERNEDTKRPRKQAEDRFKELVHYVCARCNDAPEKLGATKLNKALWYIDTIAYCKFGESVSGETAYVKQKHGPVPKRILPALDELKKEGRILVGESDYFGYTKRDFVSLKAPNTGLFSDKERGLIDDVIKIVCDENTAVSISELSHDMIWEAVAIGEDIPVYAVLAATPAKITKDHEAWADEAIENHCKLMKAKETQPRNRKKAVPH